jgi:V-type H+-transporting ATPase subunit C
MGSKEKCFIVALPWNRELRDASPQQQFQAYAQKIAQAGGPAPSLFDVPVTLKVGTLDSVMECSDDLFKIDGQVEAVAFKILGYLAEVAEATNKRDVAELGDASGGHKTIEEYLSRWKWNEAQYPTSKPLKQLIQAIQEKVFKSEDTVRTKLSEYNDVRTKLANLSKRNQGTWAVRPIGKAVHDYYRKKNMQGPVESEYLTTVFVAVPKGALKEWKQTYPTLNDIKYIVPDSSDVLEEGSEYVLVNVVVFKKFADNFRNACRERRFVVREIEANEGDDNELEALKTDKDRKRTAIIRLLGNAFTECYQGWIHLKAIRVFAESVLRYGLPPHFTTALFLIDPKREKDVRKALDVAAASLTRRGFGDDEAGDTNALEQKYSYVSLKIASPF